MNKDISYLLSIVIPTKDRYESLLPLLTYLISILNDSIEIIIQDNSKDNSQVKKFLSKYNNFNNIKYFHSIDDLSVIENCDAAIFNANGEYVCFIGDDDGIMRYTIDVVEWMKNNNIKVLKAYKPDYYWPNQQSSYTSSDKSGIVKFEGFNYKIKTLKISEVLDNILMQGGSIMGNLPSVYHGIIHKSILNNIYKHCGSYFPGPSPDMANAIAISQFVTEFTYVDFPLVISGKCNKSTGGQGVNHLHVASIDEVSHLPKDVLKTWDKNIPKYWTGQTIWAQTVVSSLSIFNSKDQINKLNYLYLYANIYVFHFRNRKRIFSQFSMNFLTEVKFYIYMVKIFLMRLVIFTKNRGYFFVKKRYNIKNIQIAVDHLEEMIDLNKMPIKHDK